MFGRLTRLFGGKGGRAAQAAQHRHALVGPPELWHMKRQFQFSFMTGVGLRPEHYLLDIGCGTLRGGIPIIAYLEPGHYYGLEVRREVLEEGKKELAEARLEHKTPALIHSAALDELRLEREFDYLWAFSVLQHMEDDILEGCFACAARHLKEDGAFYANTHIGRKGRAAWFEFPVVWREMAEIAAACGRHGLAVEDMGTLQSLGHDTGIEEQDVEQRMLRFRRE